MPVIYTPDRGRCLRSATLPGIYRRARGVFILLSESSQHGRHFAECANHNIKDCVVADWRTVLGLGDQGHRRDGDPYRLSCHYTPAGGISPTATLPLCWMSAPNNQLNLIRFT